MNTHIRVLHVTLIWVLGHTLVWVSSNNLYVVYHRLTVLIYILLFIAVMDWRLCAYLSFFYFASLRFEALRFFTITNNQIHEHK